MTRFEKIKPMDIDEFADYFMALFAMKLRIALLWLIHVISV